MKPIILFTTITSTIGTLQLFDEVVNITKGGPGNATMSISQYIYNLSFEYTPNFGYAATVSYSIVVMVLILTLIQNKLGGIRDNENQTHVYLRISNHRCADLYLSIYLDGYKRHEPVG